MVKDDYYVIVYKILAYLYTQLKHGELVEPKMIAHDGLLFEINKSYWNYIMTHMLDQGLIEGITVMKPWGKEVIISDLECCIITPEGIGYLLDNDLLSKAKKWLKDAKEIIPFI